MTDFYILSLEEMGGQYSIFEGTNYGNNLEVFGANPDLPSTDDNRVLIKYAGQDGSSGLIEAAVYRLTGDKKKDILLSRIEQYTQPVQFDWVRSLLNRSLALGINRISEEEFGQIVALMAGPRVTESDLMIHIRDYINARGYYFDDETVANYHICLKTRQFVILAGSGLEFPNGSGAGVDRAVVVAVQVIERAALRPGQVDAFLVRLDRLHLLRPSLAGFLVQGRSGRLVGLWLRFQQHHNLSIAFAAAVDAAEPLDHPLPCDEVADHVVRVEVYPHLARGGGEHERRLDDWEDRLHRALRQKVRLAQQKVEALAGQLEGLSPLNVLSRGYSLTRNESGQVIRHPEQVHPGERLRTLTEGGEILSRVEGKDEPPRKEGMLF